MNQDEQIEKMLREIKFIDRGLVLLAFCSGMIVGGLLMKLFGGCL
jgi:hypothetical protein